MTKASAALLGSMLLGCVDNTTIDQLRALSLADVQNATAKAVASGDVAGAWCWEALTPIVSVSNGTVGMASTIEDARIATQALGRECKGILPIPLPQPPIPVPLPG